MDRHRLAAVVARSGQNFTYLSGLAYPGTLARHLDLPDSVRGVLLVWPRDGQPVIVLNKIAEGLTRRDSWVERVEVYDAYTESPYRRLAQVLGGRSEEHTSELQSRLHLVCRLLLEKKKKKKKTQL